MAEGISSLKRDILRAAMPKTCSESPQVGGFNSPSMAGNSLPGAASRAVEAEGQVPLVSVVMPVFNTKAEYLREAVSSVLGQTLKKFELLVVDDCSEAYVGEIIRGYADERIRYFRLEENSGAAIARNYAIDRARGGMIAFLDSDDISLPERLEKQLSFLQQHPEIGLVGTFYCEIGQGHRKRKESCVTDSQIKESLLFDRCVFCQSSVMLRKAVLEENSIRYDHQDVPAEDYALWLNLVGCTQFAIIPEVLTLYRIHPASASRTQSGVPEKSFQAQVRVIEKYSKIELKDRALWEKLYTVRPFTEEELAAFSKCLPAVLDKLVEKGFSRENLVGAFKRKFKKHFYKARGIKRQWMLSHSALADFFRLPWSWRLFCFITRGIL